MASRFAFDAIGTSWEVDTPDPLPQPVQHAIRDLTDQFDATYSRFRTDSTVSKISDAIGGGEFDFPPEAQVMFELYDRLHAATDGAVDPLVGCDLERLGYDRHYTLTPIQAAKHSGQRQIWGINVRRQGSKLFTGQPLVVDLGAVGKGFLVDAVAAHLLSLGINDFLVDASGDMLHRGAVPIVIGLEHPADPETIIGTANLMNGSICASASNRRRWGDELHHVLDGRTGLPTSDVVATWVTCADAATADGLATALFFAPGARLQEDFKFAYVRMFSDGRAEISANFEGEIFN